MRSVKNKRHSTEGSHWRWGGTQNPDLGKPGGGRKEQQRLKKEGRTQNQSRGGVGKDGVGPWLRLKVGEKAWGGGGWRKKNPRKSKGVKGQNGQESEARPTAPNSGGAQEEGKFRKGLRKRANDARTRRLVWTKTAERQNKNLPQAEKRKNVGEAKKKQGGQRQKKLLSGPEAGACSRKTRGRGQVSSQGTYRERVSHKT